MKIKDKRYDDYKPAGKRFRQAFFRFCVYGSLLIAAEVAFYTVTKIARSIPFAELLFHFTREVDPALGLNHVWSVPIKTLFGQSSLYMFFVYGAICVFGLEPACRWMKRKDVPALLRGVAYAFLIMAAECALGFILKLATGYDIWFYASDGAIFRYTSLAIAPFWYVCGILSENLMNLIDSLDEMKLSAYGLDDDSGEASAEKDRIVILSDVHIGKRNADGSPAGWFYGMYEIYLTVILYKISMNKHVRELVFLGDFFDTWMYPVEEKPETVREIVAKWQDSPLMVPLLQCIEKFDAVWYIPGNHDMHVKQEDLDLLSSRGKRITLTSSYKFNAHASLLTGCDIHLEHGNDADFFNAPDHDADTVQGMPFGYFVSRLISAAPDFDYEATFRSSYRMAMLAEAQSFVSGKSGATAASGESRAITDKEKGLGHRFIELFVDTLVDFANSKRGERDRIGNDTPIQMPESYSPTTVGEVKTRYSSLLGEWLENHKTYMFAAAGKSGLDTYARKKFGSVKWSLWLKRLFAPIRNDMIVVMGHTHYGKIERVMNREKQGVYANTGCVCQNSKQSGVRWVEIRKSAIGWYVKLERL